MARTIKLFSFNRKYCHIVGIYPPEWTQNDQSINPRNWMITISFVPHFMSSTAYLFLEAKSMLEYGLAFLAASSALFFMFVYLAMIWRMKKTWPFIENCEQFIEKREDSAIVYRDLIEKIEQLCELIGIGLIITLLFQTLPFLFYSFINYYIFDLGEESFLLLFPATLPFDWKTPLGYFVAWLIQSAGIAACSITVIMMLDLCFGSCWLFIVMAKDITKDLTAFNKDVEANRNRAEWMKRFSDIIQVYSDAKECVNEFNAIIKYSLFTCIFWLMLSVTSMLLTLEFQLSDDNAKLLDTFVIFVVALWIFGILFFLCEIGERVQTHFEVFGEELVQCDWHNLPIKMQRMYFTFLSDTQQPKNITCFGNVLLTREIFKKIINTGWSYFNTIRQFET